MGVPEPSCYSEVQILSELLERAPQAHWYEATYLAHADGHSSVCLNGLGGGNAWFEHLGHQAFLGDLARE